MKTNRPLFFALALIALLQALPASAQNMFIKFTPEIPGSATEASHVNWITGYGLSHGGTIACSIGSPGCSGVSMTSVHIMKVVDKATPLLLHGNAMSSPFTLVEIEVCNSAPLGGDPIACPYKLKLFNTRIESASVSTEGCLGGNCGSSDSYSLFFEKIQWSFLEIDPSTGKTLSTVCKGWDLLAGKSMICQ